MKILNNQINQKTSEALREFTKISLPIKVSLRVIKVIRKYDELANDIDNAIKILQEKYSVKDDEGNTVVSKDEDGRESIELSDTLEFKKELNDLLSEENEIDIPELTEHDLGNIIIEPSVLLDLDWLFSV